MSSNPPETGPVQIGDGEVGVYLDRSDAIVYAVTLEQVLPDVEKSGKFKYEANVLRRLVEHLRSAQQRNSEHRRALQKIPTSPPTESDT